ncbi:hypothetical protein [Nonomuraea cavernae]|uniref:hypothetical protein n=1 Tax=Nonomuraea cavernae TaxID=2045107 RepID=UPI0033C1AE66
MLALWLALLGVSVWAVRARSPWGLLVPVAAVGVWLGGVSAGEAIRRQADRRQNAARHRTVR